MTTKLLCFATTLTGWILLAGCAEHTTLVSHPPGAQIYVNDKLVGTAPVVLSVPRDKMNNDFRYRAELSGYQSEEGPIPKQTMPGRITGMVFTLGVTALFRGPTGFVDPIDVTMRPNPIALKTDAGTPPSHSGTIAERLERARKLRESGAITDQEYEERKQEILRDF